MQFVIGQQLNAFREVFFQDGQRKPVPGAFVRRNVVQRLLEREPVHGLGSVGVEFAKHAAQPVFARQAFAGWRCA